MMNTNPRITIVLASLRMGGAERAMVNLANGFAARGLETEIVLIEKTGEFISQVNSKVKISDLGVKRARNGILAFRRYLKKNSPDVLIVSQTHVQLMVCTAVVMTDWKGKHILNEQSTFSSNIKNKTQRLLASLMFWHADFVTAVSEGAAQDLIKKIPSIRKKIEVISNPVFSDDILIKKEEKISHPYLDNKDYPVILSAGRLTKSKNYELLLDAFELVIRKKDARLIILGEGEERSTLEKKIKKHSLNEFISLPGNVSNPYAYMNRCDAFVLSSSYEGLPSVLIEALACGCKIVSTDCPNGPSEILENGKYGTLVPLNSAGIFADAILNSFSSDNDKAEKLKRARDFSIESITGKYLDLIENISNGR